MKEDKLGDLSTELAVDVLALVKVLLDQLDYNLPRIGRAFFVGSLLF